MQGHYQRDFNRLLKSGWVARTHRNGTNSAHHRSWVGDIVCERSVVLPTMRMHNRWNKRWHYLLTPNYTRTIVTRMYSCCVTASNSIILFHSMPARSNRHNSQIVVEWELEVLQIEVSSFMHTKMSGTLHLGQTRNRNVWWMSTMTDTSWQTGKTNDKHLRCSTINFKTLFRHSIRTTVNRPTKWREKNCEISAWHECHSRHRLNR